MTKNKWRFAIGTTSLVPTSVAPGRGDHPRRHYLIADVDTKDDTAVNEVAWHLEELKVNRWALFPTRNGWHLYTDAVYRWPALLPVLAAFPHVDPNWLRIGRRRGYFYLADKTEVKLDWPVIRMVLHQRGATRRRVKDLFLHG